MLQKLHVTAHLTMNSMRIHTKQLKDLLSLHFRPSMLTNNEKSSGGVMKFRDSIAAILISVSALGHLAIADVRNVMLRPMGPINPSNPFMACLKSRILQFNPTYDFGAFPGTEMVYDELTPHMLAKTDVTLVERASGKRYLFKVVLTSTDTANGWQYYMDGSGITVWSRSVADTVMLSRAPNQSPTITSFSIAGCPSSE
jgi:hypothetical protein